MGTEAATADSETVAAKTPDATPPRAWVPLPRYIMRKRNALALIRPRLHAIDDFLDVGCGAGDLACALADLGLRGAAFDFSADAIEIAETMRRERGIDSAQLAFTQSDATLAQMSGRHDLVLCMEVLEHIEHDRAAFEELVRLTDRYLLLSVPAKRRLFGPSDVLAGHYRRYDRADLDALVQHDDMRIVRVVNYGYPFTNLSRILLERGSRKALEARAQREAQEAREDTAQAELSSADKAELSKTSGIHGFKLGSLVRKIDLETWMWPAYQISRLFNRSDFGEAYLVLLERKSAADAAP